jgi:excisionase family DNA binding protein
VPAHNNKQFYTIGEAARYLNKSIMTLRRWVDSGKIICIKTKGGFRRFSHDELQRVKEFGPLEKSPLVSVKQAASELGISKQTLKRWGKKGEIPLLKDTTNHLVLPKEALTDIEQPKLFDFFGHHAFPHEFIHVGFIVTTIVIFFMPLPS